MAEDSKLRDCFVAALGIRADQVVDALAYNGIREWDSVGHMALMSELETAFDIMLDTDDILALSSYAKAREILVKYGVTA
jgi:acyl carrier protein